MGEYRFGRFRLDTDKNVLYLDNDPVSRFPRLQAKALGVLVESRGKVISNGTLDQTLWSGEETDHHRSRRNLISQIRKVLRTGTTEECIRTFPKTGYCFVHPLH